MTPADHLLMSVPLVDVSKHAAKHLQGQSSLYGRSSSDRSTQKQDVTALGQLTHSPEPMTARTHRSQAVTMSVIEPTIRLRRLGLALRRCREAAGLTPEEAADLLMRSSSSILRIERGLHHTPVRDVEY